MLGNWICVTNYYDYYDIGVRTNDYLQFDTDGVYSSRTRIKWETLLSILYES